MNEIKEITTTLAIVFAFAVQGIALSHVSALSGSRSKVSNKSLFGKESGLSTGGHRVTSQGSMNMLMANVKDTDWSGERDTILCINNGKSVHDILWNLFFFKTSLDR
jgi:hypothetical protein